MGNSQKIDVTVRRGAESVEHVASRPVRLLPDNTAGIVYGGAVYPLYSDDSIDLTDEGFEKELCSRFVAPNTRVPYVARAGRSTSKTVKPLLSKWFLEENRFGFYLVFDGPEATAQRVADRMVESGLGVKRWDASFRPASDGYHYDWFVRLEQDGPDTPRRVRAALGSPQISSVVHETSSGFDAESAGRLDAVLARVDEITAKLGEAEIRSNDLQILNQALTAENEALIADLRRAKRAATTENRVLRRAKADLANATTQLDRLTTERDRLRQEAIEAANPGDELPDSELKRAREEIEHLFYEWEESEAKAAREESLALELQGRLQEVLAERDELRDKVALLDEDLRARSERKNGALRSRGGLEAFLARLLPRTCLHPDAIDALSGLAKPEKTLQTLLQLDQEERGKTTGIATHPLGGCEPWHEVDRHLATGATGSTSGGGRIYLARERSHLWVMVHVKTDQKSQDQAHRRLRTWRPWSE